MSAINIYNSVSLTDAITFAKPVSTFVLDSIFQTPVFNSSDKVDIEIELASEGVAQFVSADGDAIPVKKDSKKLERVTIPRTYEFKTFTTNDLNNLKALGLAYADAKTKDNLFNKEVMRNLVTLRDRIKRRQELMACMAIGLGKIQVSQDNIEFKVDFKFAAGKQIVTCGGDDLWSSSKSDPLAWMQDMEADVVQRSGRPVTMRILGRNAAKAFKANAAVKATQDTLHYMTGNIDLTQKRMLGATYLGNPGGIDTYEYNQQYKNSSGTLTDMISTSACIFIAGGHDGFRKHFAPVERFEGTNVISNLVEVYVNAYTNDAKTKLVWEIEQKSLPAVHTPDCIVAASVL